MFEALAHEFMQNALLAGILAGIVCGMIGSLVVVNRQVFLAGGIAHSAYGGIGLAFFFGLPVMPCAMGFTLFASAIMAGVTLKNPQRSDTIIGVLWAAGMALGIILLDITPGYNVDLMSYLFGSILTVPRSEIWIMVGLVIAIIIAITLFYREFLILAFDPEFARTQGVHVGLMHFVQLAMVALSVVMIIQVVGLILVIALLTIPPYIAGRTSRSLFSMMIQASLWGIVFCTAGMALSYTYNITTGAAIIAVATVTFFLVLAFDALKPKTRG
ncbi:MAG: metal ABC transporter permease [Desulfoplanes sp.]|nr:metal ABC transporter permease [Desulfoplanes sp.]